MPLQNVKTNLNDNISDNFEKLKDIHEVCGKPSKALNERDEAESARANCTVDACDVVSGDYRGQGYSACDDGTSIVTSQMELHHVNRQLNSSYIDRADIKQFDTTETNTFSSTVKKDDKTQLEGFDTSVRKKLIENRDVRPKIPSRVGKNSQLCNGKNNEICQNKTENCIYYNASRYKPRLSTVKENVHTIASSLSSWPDNTYNATTFSASIFSLSHCTISNASVLTDTQTSGVVSQTCFSSSTRYRLTNCVCDTPRTSPVKISRCMNSSNKIAPSASSNGECNSTMRSNAIVNPEIARFSSKRNIDLDLVRDVGTTSSSTAKNNKSSESDLTVTSTVADRLWYTTVQVNLDELAATGLPMRTDTNKDIANLDVPPVSFVEESTNAMADQNHHLNRQIIDDKKPRVPLYPPVLDTSDLMGVPANNSTNNTTLSNLPSPVTYHNLHNHINSHHNHLINHTRTLSPQSLTTSFADLMLEDRDLLRKNTRDGRLSNCPSDVDCRLYTEKLMGDPNAASTIASLRDTIIALQLQNTELSLCLQQERRRREECESVLEKERNYIQRLEDSIKSLKNTRLVIEPNMYRQIAETYIASRRAPIRRTCSSGVQKTNRYDDLVCDSGSDTSLPPSPVMNSSSNNINIKNTWSESSSTSVTPNTVSSLSSVPSPASYAGPLLSPVDESLSHGQLPTATLLSHTRPRQERQWSSDSNESNTSSSDLSFYPPTASCSPATTINLPSSSSKDSPPFL